MPHAELDRLTKKQKEDQTNRALLSLHLLYRAYSGIERFSFDAIVRLDFIHVTMSLLSDIITIMMMIIGPLAVLSSLLSITKVLLFLARALFR